MQKHSNLSVFNDNSSNELAISQGQRVFILRSVTKHSVNRNRLLF